MMLRNASSRLVEPMDVQRKARLNKKLKSKNFTQGSMQSTENDYKSFAMMGQTVGRTTPDKCITIGSKADSPELRRRAIDLMHTPQAKNSSTIGSASKWADARNLLKTTYGSSLDHTNDPTEEVLSMPTRDCARQVANASQLQWESVNKPNRFEIDDSDISFVQVNKSKIPSLLADTEERYNSNMRRTMQHRAFGERP